MAFGCSLTTRDVLLSFPQFALLDPWEDAPGDGLGYGGTIVLSSLLGPLVRVPTGGGVTDANEDDPWKPGDDVLPNNDLVLSPEKNYLHFRSNFHISGNSWKNNM